MPRWRLPVYLLGVSRRSRRSSAARRHRPRATRRCRCSRRDCRSVRRRSSPPPRPAAGSGSPRPRRGSRSGGSARTARSSSSRCRRSPRACTVSPPALAPAADGGVWLVTGGDILHVTPGGAVTDYASSLPSGADAARLAVTSDGSLWFTDASGGAGDRRDQPGRRRPRIPHRPRSARRARSASLRARMGMCGSPTAAVASGASPRPGRSRCTPPAADVRRTSSPVPTATSGSPRRAAFVGVGRITPAGSVTEFATGASAIGWQYIAAGPDGRLYFTEPFGLAPTAAVRPRGDRLDQHRRSGRRRTSSGRCSRSTRRGTSSPAPTATCG